MNQRKVGIFLSYLNIILHVAVGFLYVPILLKYIGKNEYGLYQLIGSLIAYFSIMDFGLTAAVTRFYIRYKSLKDEMGMENILAVSLYGYIVVTVLCLTVGGIFYFYLELIFGNSMTSGELTEAKQMFMLLLFNIAVNLATMVFRAVIHAHEKFLFLKGMETFQMVIQPLLVVLIIQKYPTAMAVAVAQTFLNVVLNLTRLYYCFVCLHIKIKYHYWNQELFAGFRRLAISVFVITVIDQFFFKSNQVILGAVQGTESVAVYSVASLVYMNYMALSTAISGVYLPHITEMVTQKKSMQELSALFTQIGRWQYFLLALVATGFILFGKHFILVWAGTGFSDAYWITIIIILPFTIDLIQNIGLAILQAMNVYEMRAKVYLAVGILNLAMAFPLGVKFGGIGCAFATGFSMLLGNGLVMNYLYARYIGLNIKEFWRQIGRITVTIVFCLAAGYVLNVFLSNSSIVLFLLKAFLYVLGYGYCVYRFAMNQYEKEMVARIIGKLSYVADGKRK